MLLLILTICILFSGCLEESDITQTNESVYKGAVNLTSKNNSSTTLSSEVENIPEIEVRSLSRIYTFSNSEKTEGYYFNWDNVPGNETRGLISYLKDVQEISREDDAQIVKTSDNETIRVITSGYSIEFKLKNNKTKILATIDSKPWYNWDIKNENGKIRIYESYKSTCNITERQYLVYDLSIKNKGSKNLDFKLNELTLCDGNNRYNAVTDTINEPESPFSYRRKILSDLENETKIKDTALYPGQIINGSVIYQVNSPYNSSYNTPYNSSYNESFLLLYKETLITSASLEKSIEALRTAEKYNYSVVFGIPPYNNGSFDGNSFEPDFEAGIWPNYVNRSIVEFFKKIDSDEKLKYSLDKIPPTETVYALKVIPDRNITSIIERNTTSFPPENHFIIVDDTGEKLINTSIHTVFDRIAILKNQTYELHSGENISIPQMHFSNVTIVKVSYQNQYGWPMGSLSRIDQDLILDDKLNPVAARDYCVNFI